MQNRRLHQWIHATEMNAQKAKEHIHHLELKTDGHTKILERLYQFLESQTEFIEVLRRLLYTNLKSISSIKPL